MAIEVFPAGVNHVDAAGRKFGMVHIYNASTGYDKAEFSCKITLIQMSHPSIRSGGIPITNLQLSRLTYEKGEPFELSLESVQGFNNTAPYAAADGWHEQPDFYEIYERYKDMRAELKRTLMAAGFTVKTLQHRLDGRYPCHRIQFSPVRDADTWNVARVVRLLAEEGFVPRDIAREALKNLPEERAKLLESSELATAYKMVAEAHGVPVETLMAFLDRLPQEAAVPTTPAIPAPK